MRWSGFARISLLACFLTLVGRATTLQKLELNDLIQQSTAIVRAKVDGSSAMARGNDIYTVYHLEILEPIKIAPGSALAKAGSAPAKDGFTELAVPGGAAGGLRQMVPGAPVLQRDREYVLFLWTGRSGITQLMGLSQGLFTVSQSTGGRIEIVQTKASERMLDTSGRAVQPAALRLPIEELRLRVRSMAVEASPGKVFQDKTSADKTSLGRATQGNPAGVSAIGVRNKIEVRHK